MLLKFSDFVNCDHSIRKITSKSTRLQPVFIKIKRFEVNKKHNFSSEKRMSIYDYAHSLFGEDFYSNALYWYIVNIMYVIRYNVHIEVVTR